jgi:poly-gamma-glutamate synthesis protein (capsule biosynthesis protein)
MRHWFVVACAVLGASAILATLFTLPKQAIFVATPLASAEVKSITQPLKIMFVGDIMLDRSVAAHAYAVGDGALFKGVEKLFVGSDVLIGNLEGTITTNQSISQADHSILRFTFDPHFANLLSQVGFTAVSLANNHALDFGRQGYDSTVNFLDKAGITAFGSPLNDSHILSILTLKGEEICLLGYHSLFDPTYRVLVEAIQGIRLSCDHIIVMAHWGEEYHHEPVAQQRESAHAFIDAGADVVIGGHPHVVEPLEIYNNHAIFYSLGNFIFDQGFSAEVKRGVAVGIEFTKDTTAYSLTPVTTFQEASLATSTVREAVLKDIVTTELPPEIAESIVGEGFFELPTQN